MDGFAVQADATFGAGPHNPLQLRLFEHAYPVNTGRPIPAHTNAVIMIENVNFLDDEIFEIESAVTPWKNVRRVGEDFVASEMVLPGRHTISAYELGALIAAGAHEVSVVRKPHISLIPTGSELAPADKLDAAAAKQGLVPEYNTVILAGIIEQLGGVADRRPIVPDDYDALKAALLDAVRSDSDMVVINAGSSAGSEDYTAALIRDLGEVLVHGVAMMPGKPTILGIVENKPVIGNPGYPVSAVISFEVFAKPIIETMLRLPESARPTLEAVSARKIPSKLGQEEFFRVKLGNVAGRVIAAPLPRGAGSITTLTKADGILRIPAASEGIDQGSHVRVELLRKLDEIHRTLVMIGSHDLTLDVLADELIEHDVYLSTSHVGSLGGLLALKNKTAHFAASHLLDAATGEYNWSYIRRYIPDIPVRVVNGVMREQGFIVPKGNPVNIKSFEDLARPDVRFINRQAGAGTRVLLDYYLEKEGIDPDSIIGYDMEEYTHTSVAVAVLSGVADVGMGVPAAAYALGMDFVPLAVEEYDLVIPEEYLEDEKIKALLEVLRSRRYKERIQALGGYGIAKTGQEIPESAS